MERVMIFIDGSNILHALLRLKERGSELKLDYQKLVNVLVGGRELRRAYFYCGKSSPPSEGQERFLKSLQRMGIAVETRELRQRTIRCSECKHEFSKPVEKGVDVALVTGLLSLNFKNAYDTAIIVGGDKDFLDAIEVVKEHGKRVEIAAFMDSISQELQLKADKFIPLDTMKDGIRQD